MCVFCFFFGPDAMEMSVVSSGSERYVVRVTNAAFSFQCEALLKFLEEKILPNPRETDAKVANL